ncbi:MAG TPA: hypothetical protein VHU44_06975 [Acidobacteriaceae bacterium]|jgi:hypothetical protein|nr:hypothetical protein [Acidobacteriaceae bacterium]
MSIVSGAGQVPVLKQDAFSGTSRCFDPFYLGQGNVIRKTIRLLLAAPDERDFHMGCCVKGMGGPTAAKSFVECVVGPEPACSMEETGKDRQCEPTASAREI